MNKEILITGASGFAGSHQVDKAVADGRSVVAAVRTTSDLSNLSESIESPLLTLAKLDLTNRPDVDQLIDTYKPNILIHLAANSNVAELNADPHKALDNYKSTVHILAAVKLRSPSTKVVITGSSHEYGIPENEYPQGLSETTPFNPQNKYGLEKVHENYWLELLSEEMQMKVVKSHVFNHSGARRPDKFLDGMLARDAATAKLKGKKWNVELGSKQYSRDWQHVSNWVDANLVLAQKGISGERYNVASGQSHSLEQFVEAFAQELGIPFEITENPARLRAGDPLQTFANVDKIKKLGWISNKSFEEMVTDSARFWMQKLAK